MNAQDNSRVWVGKHVQIQCLGGDIEGLTSRLHSPQSDRHAVSSTAVFAAMDPKPLNYRPTAVAVPLATAEDRQFRGLLPMRASTALTTIGVGSKRVQSGDRSHLRYLRPNSGSERATHTRPLGRALYRLSP